MAYDATVTLTQYQIAGQAYTKVTITETGNTGTSDEKEITGLPPLGVVTHVKSTLATGGSGVTATQVDPQLGEVTNSNAVWENTSAGTGPREGNLSKNYVSSGSLFWRAKADGNIGSTGTIVSTIVIKHGHHP